MAFVRDDFISQLKLNLGRKSSVDNLTNTDYLNWLNFAQDRLARAFYWNEFRTSDVVTVTVAGNVLVDKFYEFNLAAGTVLRHVYALIRKEGAGTSTSVRIIGVPQGQFDSLAPASDTFSTGDPTHYTRWDQKVEWYPVPDANFDMLRRYTSWPKDFDLTNNIVSGFRKKDDIITALATSNAFHSLGMRQDGREWFGQFADMFDKAVKDNEYTPDITLVGRKGTGVTTETIGQDYWLDPFQTRTP
jgi:hypothetical protein